MKASWLLTVVVLAGCADKRFVSVGNNRMVLHSSVVERAKQKDIPYEVALAEMRAESHPSDAELELIDEARRRGIRFEEYDALMEEEAAQPAHGTF